MLLAAGAGRRFGQPKALASTDGRSWLVRSIELLHTASCDPLLVVIGAAADQARPLIPPAVRTVENPEWRSGLGSSLRVGLAAASELDADVQAVLVMLVDLPGVTVQMIRLMLARPVAPGTLAQAVFDGQPGHPVLLGRAHWSAIAESASGDTGARSYLVAHHAVQIPVGSAAEGADIDVAPAVANGNS